MTETPCKKLILQMAIPSIVSMLVTSIYNLADTFFVGKLGTSATGAVGIVFTIMAVFQALGYGFGVGASNWISRKMGEQEFDVAAKTLMTGVFAAVVTGAIFAAFGLLFLEPFMRLIGATDTILPYAMDYARVILIGGPFIIASFVFNCTLRGEGSTFLAMGGIVMGAVLNIGLDPLFIFTFHWGVTGAAAATVLGQILSFALLLSFYLRGKSSLRLKLSNISPHWATFKPILWLGMPSFFRQMLYSVSSVALNIMAKPFGDATIAAMSIVMRVSNFIYQSSMGFGQGFQPVCGFNFGAKKYGRVRESIQFTMCVLLGITIVLSALVYFWAGPMIALFREGDADVIRIGADALRFQCIAMPFNAILLTVNMSYQVMVGGPKALVIAMLRQGVTFMPMILILPHAIGLAGVQLAQPLADVAAGLICVVLLSHMMKNLKKAEESVES